MGFQHDNNISAVHFLHIFVRICLLRSQSISPTFLSSGSPLLAAGIVPPRSFSTPCTTTPQSTSGRRGSSWRSSTCCDLSSPAPRSPTRSSRSAPSWVGLSLAGVELEGQPWGDSLLLSPPREAYSAAQGYSAPKLYKWGPAVPGSLLLREHRHSKQQMPEAKTLGACLPLALK
jgi:hypothetical protein